jgi:serine/threonine-protein kinase
MGPPRDRTAAGEKGDVPARRLEQLWQAGARPDVDAFLAACGPLAPLETAAVLRVDQGRRWQAGERVPAEAYLRRHPRVAEDRDAAFDLIFHEFLLREWRGERPSLDEYRRRFPALAEVLKALGTGGGDGAPPVPRSEATTAYTAPFAPDGPPERPVRPALVPVAGAPGLTGEIQTLLRKRLRIVVLIVLAFYAVQGFLSLLSLFGWFVVFPVNPTGFGFTAFTIALAATLAALLLGKRSIPLRGLRAIELTIFFVPAAITAWFSYGQLRSDWLDEYARAAGGVGTVIFARSHALHWFALIVIYGTYIPNTWRRCAVCAGLMALIPVALGAGVALGEDASKARLIGAYLVDLGIWMATALAVAVYSSHRIEVLRREAFEARRFGQYRLKERLGGGGMGEVYLAEHVLLRRPCALKLIRPERAGDREALRRFEREVQATAALTSWHTVEIYDYGHSADGTFYYVMEYLPGLSLEQLVKRDGPLAPARAVRLLRQLCSALREAHAAGLVHRDLKPGNVIVGDRGGQRDVAKLLDFGLVRACGPADDPKRLTRERTILGTPAFMSPEQAAGEGDVDARSDLYSLGAVTYFLLTGRPPFVRPTAVQTLAAHLGDPPAPLADVRPDVPADVQAVVMRCLEKAPSRRFATAAELDEALAPCEGERPEVS